MHRVLARVHSVLATPIAVGLLSLSGALPTGFDSGIEQEGADQPEVHRVDRGEGAQALLVPIGEELRYGATLRTALADLRVGTVEMKSGVDAKRRSLLSSATNRGASETAWISARAFGDYTLYVMDAQLETRFLGEGWPYSVHKYDHRGTEKRRRELLTGEKNGEWVGSYRGDTSRGAPEGLRVWGGVHEQPVPRGAMDTLTAVYLVRSAMAEGLDQVQFAMLDKTRIWDVSVELGDVREVETPAGLFRARPVGLETRRIDPGAEQESDDEEDSGEFAGPFGIKGNIELLLEVETGIPLVIRGELPLVLGDLEIDLRLESFTGTPSEFAPLQREDG
ncbi:MAG: DUF3108 domain-containing protein [Planctomycetota bacterium]|jgi:hypothetical protein